MSTAPSNGLSDITPEPPSSDPDDHHHIMADIPNPRGPVVNCVPTPISPLPTPYGIAEPTRSNVPAEHRLRSPRAASSAGGRRHLNTSAALRPASQVITRLIPRPRHVIDTATDRTHQARARNSPTAVPHWPRISAEQTIAHLPYNLVRQLGLDSVDVELVDRLIDVALECSSHGLGPTRTLGWDHRASQCPPAATKPLLMTSALMSAAESLATRQ
ncbi:hypothetical protein PGT21_012584 [Puccinia graminis f. sp. tritici]|uniref:Uncharacterized protein n=1 Tax=Puccinia graminis f. sp. tritici TaxID=56615 RepID=A0A5B0QF14_PUCGR|nr:hypothetical protein PGT21_012584 [Puccinia graminis f. sp. tritici]